MTEFDKEYKKIMESLIVESKTQKKKVKNSMKKILSKRKGALQKLAK